MSYLDRRTLGEERDSWDGGGVRSPLGSQLRISLYITQLDLISNLDRLLLISNTTRGHLNKPE